jgi:hypothetical protein
MAQRLVHSVPTAGFVYARSGHFKEMKLGPATFRFSNLRGHGESCSDRILGPPSIFVLGHGRDPGLILVRIQHRQRICPAGMRTLRETAVSKQDTTFRGPRVTQERGSLRPAGIPLCDNARGQTVEGSMEGKMKRWSSRTPPGLYSNRARPGKESGSLFTPARRGEAPDDLPIFPFLFQQGYRSTEPETGGPDGK